MFTRHYRLYANLLLTADLLATFPALVVAYNFRHYIGRFAPVELSQHLYPELLPFSTYLFYLLLSVPLMFVVLMASQRYRTVLNRSIEDQLWRSCHFVIITGSILGLIVYALKLEISRPVFFLFLFLLFVFTFLNRILLHYILRSRNINEHNQIRILVVGTDQRARSVGERLETSRKWGYHVVGYLRRGEEERAVSADQVLGSLSDLRGLLKAGGVADEIIFTNFQNHELKDLKPLFRLCEEMGIRTRVTADIFPTSTSRISLEFLDELPLISFSSVPEHNLSVVAKRVIDFLVAAALLILLSPLLLLTALFVKFTSPGPVFYRQTRCGLYGRRFDLIKFRTMIDGAEDRLWEIRHLNEMDGPVFKMRNDPRVTPAGRYLRRFSIDELPQLWNVIKGEMSMVGPRAPLPEEVGCYTASQMRRLSVKPGITCLWQVSGRSDIDFTKWMEMDLQYIDNWSVWLDLQIILKTIPAVFTGRGAR